MLFDPEQIADRVDVHRALSKLDQRAQGVLYQIYFMGLSQDQVAANLGVTQPTVSKLIKKALASLREDLSK
jgi:RNA polymerase sigma factor (sigma-70 family)